MAFAARCMAPPDTCQRMMKAAPKCADMRRKILLRIALFLRLGAGNACQNSVQFKEVGGTELPLGACPVHSVTIDAYSERRRMPPHEDPGQNNVYVREQRFNFRCAGRKLGSIYATTASWGIIEDRITVQRGGQRRIVHKSIVDNVGSGAVVVQEVTEESLFFAVTTWRPWDSNGYYRYRYDWQTGKLYSTSD